MGERGRDLAVVPSSPIGQVMDGMDGHLQSEDADPEDEPEREEATQAHLALTASSARDWKVARAIHFTVRSTVRKVYRNAI